MDFYAFDSRPTMASMALGSGPLGHPRRHGMAFDAEQERAFDLCDTARRGSAGAPSGALRPARSAGGPPRRCLSLRRRRLRRPLIPTDSAARPQTALRLTFFRYLQTQRCDLL